MPPGVGVGWNGDRMNRTKQVPPGVGVGWRGDHVAKPPSVGLTGPASANLWGLLEYRGKKLNDAVPKRHEQRNALNGTEVTQDCTKGKRLILEPITQKYIP